MTGKNIEIMFGDANTVVIVDNDKIFNLRKVKWIDFTINEEEFREKRKSVQFTYENFEELQKNKGELDTLSEITNSKNYIMSRGRKEGEYLNIYGIDFDESQNISLEF